ncbi:MAG: hydantoinase/oxoprolinase family protein [Acidimicrobiales bacterium]
MTTILNARLIALVDELLAAVRASLVTLGISAPLVIVRGDGSLLSDTATRHAPIETILSGPAASVVGAAHLVGQRTALVADIGGTTTDVAVMLDGRPRLNPAGATVGGHLTMVQAVDVTTVGLGGDSTVTPHASPDRRSQLIAGPGRVLPISLLAVEHPEFVRSNLRRQSELSTRRESFAQFVVPTGRTPKRSISRIEQDVLDALGAKPAAADQFIDSGARSLGIDKLAQAGFVRRCGFTPTDAAHILGIQADFDADTARLAGTLLVQVWNGLGFGPWDDVEHLARDVMATVTRRSAEIFLDVCLARDGLGGTGSASTPIMAAALDQVVGLTAPSIQITLPVVGLGASAATYHTGVAQLLGTDVIIPEHAKVANAVGAVVGQVRTTLEARITQPHRGTYAIHGVPDNARFQDLDEARKFLEATLAGAVAAKATVEGAEGAEISITWQDKTVTVGDKPYLVEGHLTVEAIGRPRLADRPVSGAG